MSYARSTMVIDVAGVALQLVLMKVEPLTSRQLSYGLIVAQNSHILPA